MSPLAFSLVLFSGLMHALYNFLIKQSRNKTVFIWWLFVVSTGMFTIFLPVLPGSFSRFDATGVLLAAAGAGCFVLYHLFAGKAYRGADLSVAYPLTQTSMLYVPVWAVCFLSEKPSLPGVCGISLVAAGAYLTQLRKIKPVELLRPFRSLLDNSARPALAAGFIYSVGAIIDKTGVNCYPTISFTYLLIVGMLVLMSVNLLRSRHRTEIMAEWRQSQRFILAGGPLMVGSFLTFRFGLALSPMSYAVPVRQVSVLVGVLIGILFLGEPCGRIRLFAASLILAGVCLIRLG